jgi:tRNA threonylcarbamoyl adenosine modification protein YeaZ
VLLAIDTSAGTSVAIVDRLDGAVPATRNGASLTATVVLAERLALDTRGHAEIIGTLIRECLDEAGIEVTALTGVAVGMGPGPFTGLRVGIAAARSFAWGARIPVFSVISHDAIALDTLTSLEAPHSQSAPLIVVTDARRKEVYWSTYAGLDDRGLPRRLNGPGLVRPAELSDVVPQLATFQRVDAVSVRGSAIGALAVTLAATGGVFAGENALYLREPDVTVSAGPKRVSS